MDKGNKILLAVLVGMWVIALVVAMVLGVTNHPEEEPQTNIAAHYVVGEDNVTGIEIVYAQTHDLVDELIIYKDDTAVARRSKQHIYITPSQCKIIIYRGE